MAELAPCEDMHISMNLHLMVGARWHQSECWIKAEINKSVIMAEEHYSLSKPYSTQYKTHQGKDADLKGYFNYAGST